MTSYKQLFQAHSKFINQIPFIKLGEVDNLQELTNEALNFYKNHKPAALLSTHPVDLEYTGVDVLGIYDYSGKNISQFGESHFRDHHDSIAPNLNYQLGERTFQTDLGKDLPKISAVVDNLLDNPGRVRLSKLRSHKYGGWHSHGYTPLLEITLHIPLVSNRLVNAQAGYCCMSYSDYRYRVPAAYHTTFFKPGEIWLLNGMFSHRVVNDSDEDRIHIWSQSHFLDNDKNIVNTKLLHMLTDAMDQYQGPYLKDGPS
jgi:hypothetical protein